MNLFLDSANFTDGFTNTSSTFAPSQDERFYDDNNTWPPISTMTPAPVENSGQSSSGCLDNCSENNILSTVVFFLVFFLVFILLLFLSLYSRKQDSIDLRMTTTTRAANPDMEHQARPSAGASPTQIPRRNSTNRAAGGMSLSQRNQFVTQFLPTKLFKASFSQGKGNAIDGEQQASIEMKSLPPSESMDFDSTIPYGDDNGKDNSDDQTDPEHPHRLESAAPPELSMASPSVRECAVCLEAFCQNDEICTSNNPDCPHVFHVKCMHSWLLRQEECPCCRRPYLQVDSKQELLF